MNIVRKDIDQVNLTLTVEITKSDYAENVDKKIREYRKKANIPGFRPGMVPASLVKKMYGKAIIAEEINKLVSDELFKYIRENKINMLGEPMPNEDDQKTINFDTQEEFELTFDVAVAPDFDVALSKNDTIPNYSIAVSDEMIDNQVKTHTSRYGKYIQEELVEEKDMVKGALLELANGIVNENGIKLDDATLTPSYIKDEAQKALFVGATIGSVITFNPQLAFQSEVEISSLLKISKEEAKNITADFQITVEGITRYHEAEINQELFDKVYGEGIVSNEAEFRAKIKEGILETLSNDSDYKFGEDARNVLLAKFDHLVFPENMLKRWLLESNEKMTAEAVEDEYPKIISDLKWQLVKDKLVKANEIKVEAEDITLYARKIAAAQFAQYGMVGMGDDILDNYAKDMLKKEDTVKGIAERVAENKIFQIIKNTVSLDTKEVTVEEFNKLFEA
ncbi:MAG: trigger factor [Porphyromonadaceae bacterium CG2_30_38_12]|nr:MAG: trigger factor [Porphyromonadaceae bacterium CG2_30_38_12]